eukprot:CAMPEP_0181308628 /NCGR_PEP_ID=MMETSP1101-20121128/11571_1 /TAXON_ID=46948 /ORGANISM="Rhodomonas abbreviata, Strain Caron Lab Isolate" /LENGTH=325 /DNA_ID=CAMNT_0023415037 /DNA_START=68 /DNA_END=1041 /DNA_ORIENTATION=+
MSKLGLGGWDSAPALALATGRTEAVALLCIVKSSRACPSSRHRVALYGKLEMLQNTYAQFVWCGLLLFITSAASLKPEPKIRLRSLLAEENVGQATVTGKELSADLERVGDLQMLASRCFPMPAGGIDDLRTGHTWHIYPDDPVEVLRGLKLTLPEGAWPVQQTSAPCVTVVGGWPDDLLPQDSTLAGHVFVFLPLDLPFPLPAVMALPFDPAYTSEDSLPADVTLRAHVLSSESFRWEPLYPSSTQTTPLNFNSSIGSFRSSSLGPIAFFRVPTGMTVEAGGGSRGRDEEIAAIVAASVVLSCLATAGFYYYFFQFKDVEGMHG